MEAFESPSLSAIFKRAGWGPELITAGGWDDAWPDLSYPAMNRASICYLCILLSLPLSLRADLQVVRDENPPGRIRQQFVVISGDWIGHNPPTKRVNSPEVLESLFPGQKLVLAIVAEGANRDRLLEGMGLHIQLKSDDGSVRDLDGLKPTGLWQIKAEGADMTEMFLKAGGISSGDQATFEKATSTVTFAVFQPTWTAPIVDHEVSLQISAALTGNQPATTFDLAKIKVRPTADWMKEPEASVEDVGRFLNRYHDNLPPGRLLSLLRNVSDKGGLNSPSALAFFAVALRDRAGAEDAAITLFPSLDQKTQIAVAVAFRFAGLDIGSFLPKLPAPAANYLSKFEPLKDPRKAMVYEDPITSDVVRGIGSTMDECWGCWMATGDETYLRALVELLGGGADYPVLQNWIKTRGGVKGLNASVARGLAYQTAGWSIGAFQKADSHVADWILYWKDDPTFPSNLRKELDSLYSNPAFRQNKG
jgi:hypothetical protein